MVLVHGVDLQILTPPGLKDTVSHSDAIPSSRISDGTLINLHAPIFVHSISLVVDHRATQAGSRDGVSDRTRQSFADGMCSGPPSAFFPLAEKWGFAVLDVPSSTCTQHN